jgi:hypothetical protein
VSNFAQDDVRLEEVRVDEKTGATTTAMAIATTMATATTTAGTAINKG